MKRFRYSATIILNATPEDLLLKMNQLGANGMRIVKIDELPYSMGSFMDGIRQSYRLLLEEEYE